MRLPEEVTSSETGTEQIMGSEPATAENELFTTNWPDWVAACGRAAYLSLRACPCDISEGLVPSAFGMGNSIQPPP